MRLRLLFPPSPSFLLGNSFKVVLTLEGGLPVTDLDQSPMQLNVPLEGIYTVCSLLRDSLEDLIVYSG